MIKKTFLAQRSIRWYRWPWRVGRNPPRLSPPIVFRRRYRVAVEANSVRDTSSDRFVSVFICDTREGSGGNRTQNGGNRTRRNQINAVTVGDTAVSKGKLILLSLLERPKNPNNRIRYPNWILLGLKLKSFAKLRNTRRSLPVLNCFPSVQFDVLKNVMGTSEHWGSANPEQIVAAQASERLDFIARVEESFIIHVIDSGFLKIPFESKIHTPGFGVEIL